MGKLFGKTNKNEVLFDIEKQEGSDILEGDEGLASIGDATLAHIQNLSPLQRLAYDEHILMGDGNLFRVTENPRWEDRDEYNLKYRTQDERVLLLAVDKKGNPVPESVKASILEAMEELEMREDSEDVTNHPETLIPYDQWENFPQMSKNVDIPSTPRPKLQFCGNAKQPFYDDFAWGLGSGDLRDGEPHPMAPFIASVISTLDRFEYYQILSDEEVEDANFSDKPLFVDENSPAYILTDGETEFLYASQYVKTLEYRLFPKKSDDPSKQTRHKKQVPFHYRKACYDALTEAIMNIVSNKTVNIGKRGDLALHVNGPTEMMKLALQKIESHWSHQYKGAVVLKTREWDPLYIHLSRMGRDWIARAKKGEKVIQEVNALGKELFNSGFLCTRKSYEKKNRRIKGKGVPVVKTAVQEARPYHWKKYHAIKQELNRLARNRYRTQVSKRAQEIIDYVKSMSGKVCVMIGRDPDRPDGDEEYEIDRAAFKKFVAIPNELLKATKSGKFVLTDLEWKRIWNIYGEGREFINSHIRGTIN